MAILQKNSKQLAKELDAVTAELAALREQAAEADAKELARLGATIAGMRAKQEALEARYAAAAEAERAKEAEAQRAATERAHAEACDAFRRDRAELAQRWRAWFDLITGLEAQTLAAWDDFAALQDQIRELEARGRPLGLQVGQLDSGADGPALSERLSRGGSPLRWWYRYSPD